MIDLRQKMAEHANRQPRHDRSRELLFAAVAMLNHLEAQAEDVTKRYLALLDAVGEHHAQRADDRCHLDDATLYRAAGFPAPDIRVGDREEMLKNCARFIDRRCAGGHWPTYAELEVEVGKARERVAHLEAHARRSDALALALTERVAAQAELLAGNAAKPLTELAAFLNMLARAKIGHGTGGGDRAAGTGVQVEDDETVNKEAEFRFDAAGKLVGVSISDGFM